MYREKLLEAVAEISDEYMERYFAGDEFSVEEIRSAMRTEVMEGSIVPVAMGSNIQAQGVANLLSDIVRFFPSPDWRECAGINRKTFMKQIMISQEPNQLMYLRQWLIRLLENIHLLKFAPVY